MLVWRIPSTDAANAEVANQTAERSARRHRPDQKDDVLFTNHWPLARVTETHPGKDGIVRAVTVKLLLTTYKRPVTKLAIILRKEEHLRANDTTTLRRSSGGGRGGSMSGQDSSFSSIASTIATLPAHSTIMNYQAPCFSTAAGFHPNLFYSLTLINLIDSNIILNDHHPVHLSTMHQFHLTILCSPALF